jgi:hypothetical protein
VLTVEEIKSAIAGLSLEERAELIPELCGWSDDDWDTEMRRDAAFGKFARLNEEAEATHTAGKTVELEQMLDQA